ncbi:MAG: vWA domain-containing protein [Pseudomonadota bacterium]
MFLRLLCLSCLLSLPWALPGHTQSRPLLMDGKSTLYERVLLRNRVGERSAPDAEPGTTHPPLSRFYVYDRQGDWVQVGPDDQGAGLFWLAAKDTVPWNQNIVVTFEGSENVGRVLFLSDIDEMYGVVESEDPADTAEGLRAIGIKAEQGGARSDKVIALGPRESVDQRSNLYVMPILDAEEALFETAPGLFVNLLNVAVARAEVARATPRVNVPVGATPEARQNFKAGVVFVVDTTKSMGEFIRGTQTALEQIFNQIKASDAGDVVSFGLVGYRDNMAGADGLEYAARTYVSLKDGADGAKVLAGISQMTEATASSRNFREDSYAAIDLALRDMDWTPFGAKYIVLVTDASPRGPDDKLSATGMSSLGLNRLVRERLGAVIATIHLRTPRGATDHAKAESAYKALTQQENQASLYYPIEDGDPEIYTREAQALGQLIADQVIEFRSGKDPEEFPDANDDTSFAKALRSAGRTMQLAYLGSQNGVEAPDVFEAWVADRDFARQGLKPLSVRLLINKADLSNLNEALELIIEQQEDNIISPNEFFSGVLGAAADMSRKPEDVTLRGDTNLADVTGISEMIEDLPYKSRIMSITAADWPRLSIAEQTTVINELYDKVARFRRYNASTDLWVDYLGAGDGADALLYPMLLDDLP